MRLSAFRFLFLSELVARMERSVIRERHSSSSIVPGFRCAPSGLLGLEKLGRDRVARMLPPIRPPRSEAQRGRIKVATLISYI